MLDQWFIVPFDFDRTNVLGDEYGFAYFPITLTDRECIVRGRKAEAEDRHMQVVQVGEMSFWAYGYMLPDLWSDTDEHGYALIQENGEYLHTNYRWTMLR